MAKDTAIRARAIDWLYVCLDECSDRESRLLFAVAIIELERVEFGTERHPLGDEYTNRAARTITRLCPSTEAGLS